MNFSISTSYSEVQRFLPAIQCAADSNRIELGFLPGSVYQQSAMRGKLWVATSSDKYLGHLLFGGSFPNLKVTQLFVETDWRNHAIGSRFIRELVAYGERYGYMSISARVAADLSANLFWERQGFRCSRQILGGKTTGRTINVRVRLLEVPLLFERSELQGGFSARNLSIEYKETPILRTPTYALDINSLFDLLKHRRRREAVSAMIRAGFNHQILLYLTDEAREELTRRGPTIEESPALELLQQLPVLPRVAPSDLSVLADQFRAIIFPRRSRVRVRAERDNSDLIHLANCAHHRLSGFVTSEKALLRAGDEVKRQFALDIVSPYEFLDPEFDPSSSVAIRATSGPSEVRICDFEERSRGDVERFLESLSLSSEISSVAMAPGVSGQPRRRLVALVDNKLVAFAGWTVPGKLKPEVDCFLFADESVTQAERIVEHLLETTFRDRARQQLCGVNLIHSSGQVITRKVAVDRGFCTRIGRSKESHAVFKVSAPGVVVESTWSNFQSQMHSLAGVGLPPKMPKFEQVTASGISVQRFHESVVSLVDVFDLETLLSPGILLFPGREGVVVPIREEFAQELLGETRRQMKLLPGREALLRVERAYFKAPRGVELFQRGKPLIFYISGHRHGPKQAIGSARVTSSAVVPIGEAIVRYYRQGVLEASELEKMAEKGKVHVVTFDNVAFFGSPIGYKELLTLGCVGGANYVTAESLGYDALRRLLERGYLASRSEP